jgi:hypothetical protein
MNISRMPVANRGLAALMVVAGYLAVGACASSIPTEGRSCPCGVGSVCCADNTCARDQVSCPAPAPTMSTPPVTPLSDSLREEARGQWTGYVENFSFPSGSDAIQLSFAVSGNGLTGTVILGQGSPPPPATDPDAPWPVGWPAPSEGFRYARTIEGFAYTAHDIRSENQRIRFTVLLTDAYLPWCALQTTYRDAQGNFACMPNVGWSNDGSGQCVLNTTPTTTVPCARIDMCVPGGTICACSAQGCVSAEGMPTSFDIALRGGVGDGSMSRTMNQNNIRLTRR